MTKTIEKAKQDVAPEWTELIQNVRRLAESCNSGECETFSREAIRMCDHVDQLHEDLRELLRAMESGDAAAKFTEPDSREIDLAAIETQRETHEMRADPLDILKALLMWRDDPAERIAKPR